MSERYMHRRDNEGSEFEHEREGDIPKWLKWTFIAINRVGFPIVVFFFMSYFFVVVLRNFSDVLQRQSLSLEALIVTVNGNHSESKEWRVQMLNEIRELQSKIR